MVCYTQYILREASGSYFPKNRLQVANTAAGTLNHCMRISTRALRLTACCPVFQALNRPVLPGCVCRKQGPHLVWLRALLMVVRVALQPEGHRIRGQPVAVPRVLNPCRHQRPSPMNMPYWPPRLPTGCCRGPALRFASIHLFQSTHYQKGLNPMFKPYTLMSVQISRFSSKNTASTRSKCDAGSTKRQTGPGTGASAAHPHARTCRWAGASGTVHSAAQAPRKQPSASKSPCCLFARFCAQGRRGVQPPEPDGTKGAAEGGSMLASPASNEYMDRRDVHH